jgi:hypothetical protein
MQPEMTDSGWPVLQSGRPSTYSRVRLRHIHIAMLLVELNPEKPYVLVPPIKPPRD